VAESILYDIRFPRDGVTHYSYGEGLFDFLYLRFPRDGVTHYSYGEGLFDFLYPFEPGILPSHQLKEGGDRYVLIYETYYSHRETY
jgi:hypothetical protein